MWSYIIVKKKKKKRQKMEYRRQFLSICFILSGFGSFIKFRRK